MEIINFILVIVSAIKGIEIINKSFDMRLLPAKKYNYEPCCVPYKKVHIIKNFIIYYAK